MKVKNHGWEDNENSQDYLINFVKTLFPETEEETLDRIIEEVKPTYEKKEFLRVAQIFHQERKRIEDE
jgi:hypothetical protein